CAMRLSARTMPAESSSSRFSISSLTRPFGTTLARAMSTAGIILIGDEILSGKVRDENAHFLIGELRDLGVNLRKIATIPDVLEEISATVADFAGRFDHVFTSGGVGPTHDDLTMEGVARAFGSTVMRHPE